MVRSYKSIPLYEMTSAEVGQKIASHCAGLKMVLTKRFLRGNVDAEVEKLLDSKLTHRKYLRSLRDYSIFCQGRRIDLIAKSSFTKLQACLIIVSTTPKKSWKALSNSKVLQFT